MYSRVLFLRQLLALCLQRLCPSTEGAQEPPKLLVLLQQAPGFPHVLLGVQGPGVRPGRMWVSTISPRAPF